MSESHPKLEQDITQGIKISNNGKQYNNNDCRQIKKEQQIIEQNERQKNLNQSLQGKDFLLRQKNSQLQKKFEELDIQFNQNKAQIYQSQISQKRKILDKLANMHRSMSQKQTQHLKALQQIEEFELQGKKLNDSPDRSQISASQSWKNISFETKSKINQGQKINNKQIDCCSQTIFPNIMKQQLKNHQEPNAYPQNFDKLIIKSETLKNISQTSDCAKKQKERTQENNLKSQQTKEQNVNRFATNEVLKIIAQNRESIIENNSQLEIPKIEENVNKREISITQEKSYRKQNLDKQFQKQNLSKENILRQNGIKIQTQIQPQLDSIDSFAQSSKEAKIKKYNQQGNQSYIAKKKQYKLENSKTFEFLVNIQIDNRKDQPNSIPFLNQSLNNSVDKMYMKKSPQKSLSNNILQSRIKRKGNYTKQLSQINILNNEKSDEKQQKDILNTLARKFIIEGSKISKNVQETHNNSIIKNQNEDDQSQQIIFCSEPKSLQLLKSRYIQNSRNKFPLKVINKGLEDKNQNILEGVSKEVNFAEILSQALDNQSKKNVASQDNSQGQNNNKQYLSNSLQQGEQKNEKLTMTLQQYENQQNESFQVKNILKKKFKKKSLNINKNFYSGYSQQNEIKLTSNLKDTNNCENNEQENNDQQIESLKLNQESKLQELKQIYSKSQIQSPKQESKSDLNLKQSEYSDQGEQKNLEAKTHEKTKLQNILMRKKQNIQQIQVNDANQLNKEDKSHANRNEHSSFTRNFKEIISLAQQNTSIFQSIYSDMIIISKE